ncbi:MAG: hypothetical protein ACI4C5_00745 [Lachnospiraceae bacterium]
MKKYPVFEVCKEGKNYVTYYNYENGKLYSRYNGITDQKPPYVILLILPFINIEVNMLNEWIAGKAGLERYIICLMGLLVTAVAVRIFMRWERKEEEKILSKELREITDPTQREWNYFIDLGEKELKKQVRAHIWIRLGAIVNFILFIWNGFMLFLLMYMLLYALLRCMVLDMRNLIRKHNLIKEKKQELQ